MSKTSYSETLNLPKTAFPMKGDLPRREPEILEFWEKQGVYGAIRQARKDCPKFILHDGPPYANGEIHAGTALNKVLKDILVKYHTMKGYDSPFVPGWDCHGLPIEHNVMSQLGDEAKKLSQIEIRQRCRDFALRFVDLHRNVFRRLGVFGQWEKPYLTLDPEYEAKIIEVFGELYLGGYVYKGFKPVLWCPTCQTALAEAEVEYANHVSPSIYVRFAHVKGLEELPAPLYIPIWTTTPWTLPANLATCVHPEFTYAAVRIRNETYVLAEQLLPQVLEKLGNPEFEVIQRYKGEELEGVMYKHPITGKLCSIILGEHVTLEQGTGCVHTAPGHGQEDYVVGQKYDLEVFSPVDGKGVFAPDVPHFAGMNVFDANQPVCDKLREAGALMHQESIEHSYPHCWRCLNPVIFRATPQWFISVDANGLRQRALDAIQNVKWFPEWGMERISLMVKARPDWCVSRQRAWGVPIPVFYCRKCGKEYATAESIEHARKLVLKQGADVWFKCGTEELMPPGARCACGGSEFDKESDILDVWFESGVSHRAVLEQREGLRFPAEVYLEGSDQHRGWFQSSLLPAVAVKGVAPFKTVITTGYVVAGDGTKMSKKLGNFVLANDVISESGADVLRLWVASENYEQDIRISPEILRHVADAYVKLRNTCRYLLGNLAGFDPRTDAVEYADLPEVDRWALNRLMEVLKKATEAYENHDYHLVYQRLHTFCVIEMSSFYLDVLKDRLYTFGRRSRERQAAQTVLYETANVLVRLMAPILSYTAEEVWRHMPAVEGKEPSVHLTSWPAVKEEYLDSALATRWDRLLAIRGKVAKALEEARRSRCIGGSLEAQVTLVADDEDTFKFLDGYGKELPMVFIVSSVELLPPGERAQGGENGLAVKVTRAPGKKCERCWNYLPSVGEHPAHPTICHRCVAHIEET